MKAVESILVFSWLDMKNSSLPVFFNAANKYLLEGLAISTLLNKADHVCTSLTDKLQSLKCSLTLITRKQWTKILLF